LQASAATLTRSRSLELLEKEKYEIEWLKGYQGDGSSPGDLIDSPRHKVQAAAAKMIRSHSLEALDHDGSKSHKKTAMGSIKPCKLSIPKPCFEFEQFSDSEAKEEDIDELRGVAVPSSPSKHTFLDSAWRLITRPFRKYESRPSIVAVRGRIRSESDFMSHTLPSHACNEGTPPCPPCEKFDLRARSELSHDDLLTCGAFDMHPEKNLTCEESHEKRMESLKDPACLVGYQICLLRPEEFKPARGEHGDDTAEQYDIDGVDEELVALSERLRVVVAYQKEYDRALLRRSSKYLLMKGDGSVDWFELKRGIRKRGLPFTTLRRVCE